MYTVLKTIDNYINELDNIPFEEYYFSYIEDVQDSNIELELSHVKNSAIATPIKIVRAINKEVDSLAGDKQ